MHLLRHGVQGILHLLPSFLPSSNKPRHRYHLINVTFKMQSVAAATEKVEGITSHDFTDKLLCAEAVQMAAPRVMAISPKAVLMVENNKRLSVLGDAVLAQVLSGAWFKARDDRGKTEQLVGAYESLLMMVSNRQWIQSFDLDVPSQ